MHFLVCLLRIHEYVLTGLKKYLDSGDSLLYYSHLQKPFACVCPLPQQDPGGTVLANIGKKCVFDGLYFVEDYCISKVLVKYNKRDPYDVG